MNQSSGASFVCICIGVHDSIKDVLAKTLFGLDLQFVLTSGIDVADLWDESIEASERMLWNARILPVLTSAGNENVKLNYSFLDWIDFMWTSASSFESDSDNGVCFARAMSGLKQWKESDRLSLSQIRTVVDSKAEARYRSSIPVKLFEDSLVMQVCGVQAAASIGQVYKGRLRSNGQTVAIKIQRPNTEEIVALDLYVLRWWGGVYNGIFRLFGRSIDLQKFQAF